MQQIERPSLRACRETYNILEISITLSKDRQTICFCKPFDAPT